jgi:NDP-sugar pyrophosphorylase family protein
VEICSEQPISAILFAAGRGERLRPLTDTVPKPAIVVRGKPLGAYGLRVLREIDGRIAVNLSWLAEATKVALEPYAPPETLWFVESPAALGTAGTVSVLLPRLTPTFAVMNADTITDLSVSELLTSHQRMKAPATLAVRNVHEGADFLVEEGRAIRVIDRKREGSRPGALYIGAAIFERDKIARYLDAITIPAGLAEAVFRPLAARHALAIHRHDGFAIDVGTHSALADAQNPSS